MRRPLLALLLLLAAVPAVAGEDPSVSARVQTRRVTISATFTGQRVFLHGQAIPGTQAILVVMEGASVGDVRLMEKGRVGPFWLGVRQYKLSGVPGVYLVNACASPCTEPVSHDTRVERVAWNPGLPTQGIRVGLEAIAARAHLESLSGPLESGEAERVLEGYWSLQAKRGLYAVRANAVRINREGAFYHTFALPPEAPEGKYRIFSYFFARDGLLGTAENVLFVRKSGMIAWLTRLAERQAIAYGTFTLGIAVAAGWLAGTIFKRGGRH
jgi:hypothetical protein